MNNTEQLKKMLSCLTQASDFNDTMATPTSPKLGLTSRQHHDLTMMVNRINKQVGLLEELNDDGECIICSGDLYIRKNRLCQVCDNN